MGKPIQKIIHLIKPLTKVLNSVVNIFQIKLIGYYKNQEIAYLIKNIYKKTDCTLKVNELYMVYSCALSKIADEGDFAEVGVYEGSSAKVICAAKGIKRLHLFDTFEGLPEVRSIDKLYKKGDYSCSELKVRNYLEGENNITFYKGLFPQETGESVGLTEFSFVHLDVDIYQSTLDSLEFFYPRLTQGGIILSHDYAQSEGVKKAFTEFLQRNKGTLVQLCESQVMLIKT